MNIKLIEIIESYLDNKLDILLFIDEFENEYFSSNGQQAPLIDDIYDLINYLEKNPLIRQQSSNYIDEKHFKEEVRKKFAKIKNIR
jgi:hypothetical protein